MIVMTASNTMSRLDLAGRNNAAMMASKAGSASSIARIHDGEMIVRPCSMSASSCAVISDWVTNWPLGSTAEAPTSSGDASTNTVLPSRAA